MKAVIDSDVLIDFLQGDVRARRELSCYGEKVVSVITYAEIMVGATEELVTETRHFLRENFRIVPVDAAIAEAAVVIVSGIG